VVKSDISENLPRIFGDETEIHSILINLCVNASHAMPEGGQLHVSLSAPSLQDIAKLQIPFASYLRLSVQDTGCGMDKQTQEKIFEPFFTTKEVGKGTGMGLSTVYGIIKRVGGYIEVESSPGQGSKFTLYFPVSPSISKFIPKTELNPSTGQGRILFVDDEGDIRMVAKDLLESLGYEVEVAPSGREALSLVKDGSLGFDLVIVDQFMPEMSGWLLLQKIKEITPHMPVVMTSGSSSVLRDGEMNWPPISLFLQKPFTRQTLGSAVNYILRKPAQSAPDLTKGMAQN